MNEAALKAKVLFGLGLLATFFGALYTPEIIRAIVPYVICVFIASAVLFLPELYVHAKRNISSGGRNRKQATSLRKTDRHEVVVKSSSIPHIDYDNYLIPTYLRCQEVK